MVFRSFLIITILGLAVASSQAQSIHSDTVGTELSCREQGTITPLLTAGTLFTFRGGFKIFPISNAAIELSYGASIIHAADDTQVFALSGNYYLRNREVESACLNFMVLYGVTYRTDGSFVRDAYYVFPSAGSDIQWPFRLNLFFRLGPLVRIGHTQDNASRVFMNIELGLGYAL